MKTILFYSSVAKLEYFNIQAFYKIDIMLLKELGYKIETTNKLVDFIIKKYDLSFIYFYRKGLLGAVISRLRGRSVYFTGGIDNLDKKSTSYKKFILQVLFFKLCRNFSNTCIIVSDTDLDNIRKIYRGTLPTKLILSYHTIDTMNYLKPNTLKDKLLFSSIAWMGTVENVVRKGLDKSLYIFNYLLTKPEFKNSKYFIVGTEGPGTDYLKKIVLLQNLSSSVFFIGNISEVEKINLLSRSSYYFQMSLYEGFGIAALEALLSENIVIHTANGGLRHTIKDYGIIVKDTNLSKASLEKIYDSIISFDTIKLANAKQYIKTNFSNERRLEDFRNILFQRI